MPDLSVVVNVDGTGSFIQSLSDIQANLGNAAIKPGSLRISWGGVERINDSIGTTLTTFKSNIIYSAGAISFVPISLPTKGQVITVAFDELDQIDGDVGVSSNEGFVGDFLIEPGSLRFFASVDFRYFCSAFQSTGQIQLIENSQKVVTHNFLIWDDPSDMPNTWTGHNHPNTASLKFTFGGMNYKVGFVDYQNGEILLSPQSFGFDGTPISDPPKNNLPGPDYLFQVTHATGTRTKLVAWEDLKKLTQSLTIWMECPEQSITGIKYSKASPTPKTITLAVDNLGINLPVAPDSTLQSSQFAVGGTLYTQQSDNTLTINNNPSTGTGTVAGSVNPSTGAITISQWLGGSSGTPSNFHALSASQVASKATCSKLTIRAASAPLRPGSVSVSWKSPSPADTSVEIQHSATSDLDGYFNTPDVIGIVDYAHGVIRLWFTTDYVRSVGGDLPTTDFSSLGIPGVTTRKVWMAYTSTLRYNAVAYSYLPLNADLLGIDPVRLPSDGRVPIFRPGGFVVVGHTGEVTATVSNGQTVNCARTRLSRVRVVGNNGTVINTGYSVDLNAGTVTFSDVSGYSQPVTVQHRIEDMMMTSDVQINGQLTFTRALTHDYPLGAFVSSALVAGDLRARVSVVFDQATWNGSTWADAVTGSAAVATFNDAQFPITVTNRGALTERWLVQFTNTTAFNVIGENVGVIATGSINSNCSPINPATSVPYFTIPAGGWGLGWATGNVLRFNTIGSIFPVWCVRTVQQGPETVTNDNFTILVRGDIDTP